MTTEERQSLTDRTQTKLADAHLLEDILAHVSNGGSLIELCKTWDVQFHKINSWVYANHKKQYEESLNARGEWMVQRILDELKAIGMVDIRAAYDETGRLKHPKDWPDELARVIAAVDVTEEWGHSADSETQAKELLGYTKKVKLWDKLKALELLGKNLKMFIERHEITSKVTLEDLVNGSMVTAPAAPESSAGKPV